MSSAPKVTVVVGPERDRDVLSGALSSLGAQVFDEDEIEVVAPSDSGNGKSPSTIRNVGIESACGDYLLFLGLGVRLDPGGLRTAYDFASANRSDMLCLKEMDIDDTWSALANQAAGNVANVMIERGVSRLLPITAPKLYRRQFLLEHGIRFLDQTQARFRDYAFNVLVYRHAQVISLLANTTVWLPGHGRSDAQSTTGPDKAHWGELEGLMEFVSTTLAAPRFDDSRIELLAHYIDAEVLAQLDRMKPGHSPRGAAFALRRARRLVRGYGSEQVKAMLALTRQLGADVLASRRPDRVWQLREADLRGRSRTDVKALHWQADGLHAEIECRWEPTDPALPVVRREDGRVLLDLHPNLARLVPQESLDVSSDADELTLQVCARSRSRSQAWSVPVEVHEAGFQVNAAGALCVLVRGEVHLDLESVAAGAALDRDVWDVSVRSEWLGMARTGPLFYSGKPQPAVQRGRGAVAYQNKSGMLSVDTVGRTRTLAIDAKPRLGRAGLASHFSVPLENLDVEGEAIIDAGDLAAIPDDGNTPTVLGSRDRPDESTAVGRFDARIVVSTAGAFLEGRVDLGPGRYVLYAKRGDTWNRTKRAIIIDTESQLEFA